MPTSQHSTPQTESAQRSSILTKLWYFLNLIITEHNTISPSKWGIIRFLNGLTTPCQQRKSGDWAVALQGSTAFSPSTNQQSTFGRQPNPGNPYSGRGVGGALNLHSH